MSDSQNTTSTHLPPVKISVGDAVPAWSGEVVDTAGQRALSAEALHGEAYVLYFYPKDNTPGCTTQACDFRDQLNLRELGYRVIGCSPDSIASHLKFQAKYELPFALLSDPDHTVSTQFGVWREKKNYGRTYMGIVRSTFVVSAEGVIIEAMENVRAKGHVERLMRALSQAETDSKADT